MYTNWRCNLYIDSYLLEQLVVFSELGTLKATAEKLNTTQPSVTRGMQKLEDLLGVPLFERLPNKLRLNATGKLAAKEAKQKLRSEQVFIEKIRNHYLSTKIIKIGFGLPGPYLIAQNFHLDQITFVPEINSPQEIQHSLEHQRYQLFISNYLIKNDKINSLPIGSESLYLEVDAMTFNQQKNKISFREMENLSLLVLGNIGIWRNIIEENIPNAKFLYQQDNDTFMEISRYSSFPFFSTNLTKKLSNFRPTLRTDSLRITDTVATLKLYANFLHDNKHILMPTIDHFKALLQDL